MAPYSLVYPRYPSESETQTLISAIEAKLRELLGWLTPSKPPAGKTIQATFRDNLRHSGAGYLLQMLDKLEGTAGRLSGIREALGSIFRTSQDPLLLLSSMEDST